MDAFVMIASMRDTRRYTGEQIGGDVVQRILEAGRVTGNAMNRQERRFVVLETVREDAAAFVTKPPNVRGAALVVAVVTSAGSFAGFDAGRAAQNMMLAAWNDGIASCPNAIADQAGIDELLALDHSEHVSVLLSFGHPSRLREPDRRSGDDWLAEADRVGIDAITTSV